MTGPGTTIAVIVDLDIPETVLIEGVTYRQLDHWTRRGWLRPEQQRPGSGHPRTWTNEEIDVARVMGRLVAAGLTPEAAHRVARLNRGGGQIAPGVFVLYDHRWPS